MLQEIADRITVIGNTDDREFRGIVQECRENGLTIVYLDPFGTLFAKGSISGDTRPYDGKIIFLGDDSFLPVNSLGYIWDIESIEDARNLVDQYDRSIKLTVCSDGQGVYSVSLTPDIEHGKFSLRYEKQKALCHGVVLKKQQKEAL